MITSSLSLSQMNLDNGDLSEDEDDRQQQGGRHTSRNVFASAVAAAAAADVAGGGGGGGGVGPVLNRSSTEPSVVAKTFEEVKLYRLPISNRGNYTLTFIEQEIFEESPIHSKALTLGYSWVQNI